MGATIRQVLDALDVPDDAIWTSANFEYLAADIHQYMPDTRVMWWGPVPKRGDAAYFEHMRSIGVGGFDLRWSQFPRQFASDAQSNGFLLSTWTIDKPSQWRGAVKRNVDAIETNQPGVLVTTLDSKPDGASVELVGNTLVVRGDTQDNWVRIEGSDDGNSIRVRGIHGTSLNGQRAALEFSGVHDLQVLLGTGNDVVEMFDLVLDGGISVDGGAGNDDAVIARSSIVGQSAVIMGLGTDQFSLQGSNIGSLQSDGGSGVDAIDAGLNNAVVQNGNSFDVQPVFTAWERRVS
jgi:hypothetical protein